MESGRTAFLTTLKGIDEEAFYTLKRIGLEEFSPIAAIENAATHDREHAAQIQSIVSA
jgi:hypothetical protein